MKISIKLNSKTYNIDISNPIDLSIPILFNGEQPNSYNVPKAKAGAYEDGDFIGDVRRGGGCNFETYIITPHCNGTHTECIGHITKERISVNDILEDIFIPSTLITCQIEKINESTDTYYGIEEEEDYIISKSSIKSALENIEMVRENNFLDGLIIRTLPNLESKKTTNYMKNQPAYLSKEAIDFITELGIKHLLVDIPSLDKTFDGGRLNNHHTFWGIEFGKNNAVNISIKTVTELIYVYDQTQDGKYLLNLQIAPFTADASPSRPIIFKI